jgi:hypothetical protein
MLKAMGRSLLNNAVSFVSGGVFGLAVIVLFLYFKFGSMGLQRTYEEYYLRAMELPPNSRIAYTFTGDMHGLKRDSMVVVTRTKNDDLYDETANPLADSSRVIIFDESFPSLWDVLVPQLGGLKQPSFEYVPRLRSSPAYEGIVRQSQPLECYDEEVVDLDGNNAKEVIVYWIDFRGASAFLKHVVLIYWDGKYNVAGLPEISQEVLEKTGRDAHQVEVLNSYDKTILRFPGFTTDDLVYFKDVDGDGNVELIRGLMIWGEGESHADPHSILFEAFRWKNNSWREMYWENQAAPYVIFPKDGPYRSIKSFIDEKSREGFEAYEH